ncbi:MAG: TolC family protein [Bacteroidota bacterium]
MKILYTIAVMLGLSPLLCSGVPLDSEPADPNRIPVLPGPDSLLKTVLENNRTLRSSREAYQAAILGAGTGIAPPNPEVEFGYMYGSPADMGNKVDFSVSQELDFPTAYIYKSRLRKIKTSQAELSYILARQEVLLEAKQLWIEQIYLNQQESLLASRLSQAKIINEHFKSLVESGEKSQLAYSQSNLQLVSIQSEYEQVLVDISKLRLALKEISGGMEVEISDTLFPEPLVLIPDSLIKAYMESPRMILYRKELLSKEEQKNLAVSETLPKLKAGYYSETILDQKLKGFQIGITVPLWENSNRVKQAKSEISFAESDAERFTYEQQKDLLQKLDQLESLRKRTGELAEALGTGNSMDLLAQSLESGEISQSEYFYASDFYFRNEQMLVEYKRDLLLLEAELLKVYL